MGAHLMRRRHYVTRRGPLQNHFSDLSRRGELNWICKIMLSVTLCLLFTASEQDDRFSRNKVWTLCSWRLHKYHIFQFPTVSNHNVADARICEVDCSFLKWYRYVVRDLQKSCNHGNLCAVWKGKLWPWVPSVTSFWRANNLWIIRDKVKLSL